MECLTRRLVKIFCVNEADRLEASSVKIILGNPNVQQKSVTLEAIESANMSLIG